MAGSVPRLLNVPNALSLLRLLSLPVVIYLLRNNLPAWACATFIVGMFTDILDGRIARWLNQQTRLGLFMDAVIDKIVLLAMFYELAAINLIPIAFAHLFLARELVQNGVRAVAATQGGRVIGANTMGKIKAFMQSVLVTWALGYLAIAPLISEPRQHFIEAALRVSTLVTVVLSYVFLGVFLVRNKGNLTGKAYEREAG